MEIRMTKILPDYHFNHAKRARYGKTKVSNDVFMIILHGDLEEDVCFDRADLVDGEVLPELNKWIDVHCIGIRKKCQCYFWKNPSGRILGFCTYKGQASLALVKRIKKSFIYW